MMRFQVNKLLLQLNRNQPAGQRITMQDVADATGISRGTLAGLTSFSRRPVTNTAYLEALVRFFCQRIPGLEWWHDLLEFEPDIQITHTSFVDDLYPERAARTQWKADQRQRRRKD